MAVKASKPALGTRGQPERTRAAILQAAMAEFAKEGVSGARTEAIARAAGVNTALLYYYFQDKDKLYGAVLETVFSGLAERILSALEADLPPREKILHYAGTHFDYIAGSPIYPRLMQREMMGAGRGVSPQARRMVERYSRPLFAKLAKVIEEGIAAGEFRRVDPLQFIPSMIAVIVFYFASMPVMRLVLPGDPLEPERVARRRAAVLDFISAALFAPGASGAGGEGATAGKRAEGGERER